MIDAGGVHKFPHGDNTGKSNDANAGRPLTADAWLADRWTPRGRSIYSFQTATLNTPENEIEGALS